MQISSSAIVERDAMKVLCVTSSYWPAFQFGGPIFVNHYLNKALVASGVDVTVYSTHVGLENRIQKDAETHLDGVRVFYFSYLTLFESLGTTGWQFSPPMVRALRKNLRHFDVVHIHGLWNFSSIAAAYFCRANGVPYVVTPHGSLYPYTLSKKSWKKRPYYELFVRRVLTGAAAVHYTGADEAEKSHPPLGLKREPVVVPYAIDLSEFENSPDRAALKVRLPQLTGRKVILFLSRISWKKGLDILVDAFAKVVRQREDVHLLIVGNDEAGYAEQLKKRISSLGMTYEDLAGPDTAGLAESASSAKITFTGILTGVDKLHAFAGSDIFVLPSYSENFGIVVAEAMACGLPVIISDQVGIHQEITALKAGIVTQTEPAQLAEAINTLIDNPSLRETMGRLGRQSVRERWAPAAVAASMIDVYRRIQAR